MTRSSSSSIRLLLALSLLALCGGRVQGAAPRSLFQQHYQTALGLYEAGKLEDAAREFEAAYELKRLPRLLINIAEIYRKLGHAREALKFYELYQQMEPGPPDPIKTRVEGALAEVRRALALADQAESRAAEAVPAEAPALLSPPAPPAPVVPAAALMVARPAPRSRPAPLYKKWWLWTAVGAVAAGAVVAGMAATRPWAQRGPQEVFDLRNQF